jgi:pimeloyl-ACP methyl ester carboxylesterase
VDVVLVPGLWLDASSWHEVSSRLRAAGHAVHTLTLRGLESRNADRSGIMMADHVAEIAAAVERCAAPVALTGHGEAGGLIHAVVNRLPERVARAIYIGGFPAADGTQVLSGFTAEATLAHSGDEALLARDPALAALVQRAGENAARVLGAVQRVNNPRRFEVPVTVVATEFSTADVRRWMADDVDPARELARMSTVDLVDLPAGHWPQMERVDDLVEVLLPSLHAPVTA